MKTIAYFLAAVFGYFCALVWALILCAIPLAIVAGLVAFVFSPVILLVWGAIKVFL